ncbi:MAG: bifunctional diaminohydroxyphosphoribosylaminopyrimidine deaminase/5-amino-6-(5-phosphoribosylamino)uracil reductase RibD [Lysobacterales bacterium]
MTSTTANAESDARHMARAIVLARRGQLTCHPNPAVGCVLVKQDAVIGEGWHEKTGQGHAEARALANAQSPTKGCTAYVTLEPCAHQGRTPPCTSALIDAGVSRVVAAMADPDPRVSGAGFGRLRDAGVTVECGLMQSQAEALNPGYLSRLHRSRPFVRVKLAASIDGATAMADGISQWITGEDARADGHRWRARASAVLTGIGTVLMDDPSLNPRVPGLSRSSTAIVLDSQWRMPPTARLLTANSRVIWVGCQSLPRPFWADDVEGLEVLEVPPLAGRVDLSITLQQLAQMDINELHVECGSVLSGALLDAGLVDELLVYLAPTVMGRASKGLFEVPGLESMADRIALSFEQVRQVGTDLRLILKPLTPDPAPANANHRSASNTSEDLPCSPE